MDRVRGRERRTRSTGTFPVPADVRASAESQRPGSAGERLRRLLRRGLGLQFLLAVALCGPALAWLAYRVAARHDRFVAETALGELLAERAHDVESEFLGFTETLRFCGSFFDASEKVTRPEFTTFTHDARVRHPAILAIGWAPRVTEAERAAFEANARRDGIDGYRVSARGPGRTLRSAPPADEHYPLFYVEPAAGNDHLLGFDLASEYVRSEAIRRTAETGNVAASGPLDLLAEPLDGPGADVVLGVYDHTAGARGPAAAPIGILCVAFRFGDVIDRLRRGSTGDGWSLLDLSWSNTSTGGRQIRVFPLEGGSEPRPEAPFGADHRFEVAGQEYVLHATPTALFLAEHRNDRSLLVAALVLLAWELVGLLLYVIARYWRTSSLQRQARTTGLLLHSLGEGVLMADERGLVRTANDAALRLLGVSMADLESEDWPSRCRMFQADGRTAYAIERVPLARAARGEVVDEEEIRLGAPDDPRGRWLAATARPLLDDGNVARGGVMVLRDVTAQRRSEASLRRLSSAVEQTTDAVYVTDDAGLVLEVNPGFRSMTGHADGDVLGRPSSLFEVDSPDDDVPHDRRWAGALAGEPFRGMILHRRRDGSVFAAEQTITPVRDASGRVTHTVVVMRDMTESQRLRDTDVEMRLASDVQKHLYPHGPPAWEGLDVAGAALPAVATCGDYFDYLRFPDGRFVLVIGDVSGHGLGPALLMSETRAYVHSLVDAGIAPDEILGRINAQLRVDLVDGTFVTLLLVSIDPRTRRVSHASAGHPPALLLDAAGAVKARLERTGPALGFFDDPAYGSVEGPVMEAGDVLVLMTDGVSECSRPDGGLFDEDGVIDTVRVCAGESAATVLGTIQGAIDVLTGSRPRRDDVTLVVCRSTTRTVSPAERASEPPSPSAEEASPARRAS